jgi:2-(1,2-epoxy-1,2-dihydrophenyl)acetyl-CoA isomerase
MEFATIEYAVSGGVARITLNRPESANSMNKQMAHDLMMAAIACDEDPAVRAVLLTGAGKMFCAGGDLKSFHSKGDALPSEIKEMTVYLHGATSRFSRMNAPLIIAVNGTAAGAGMSLAVSGDLVYAARSAKFTMAYTAAGLSPDGSSTYFMPRLIGLRRTQELMLTNRVLSADEALEWGLLNGVHEGGSLMGEAQTMAEKFAGGPTRAYGSVKKLLNDSFTNSLETQMELEARGITDAARSRDGKAGIDAFINKRTPDFTGE